MTWVAYTRIAARRAMRAIRGMLGTYRAGDYETALRFIDAMKDARLIHAHLTLRGDMLLSPGRLDEAEQCLRESVTVHSDFEARDLRIGG